MNIGFLRYMFIVVFMACQTTVMNIHADEAENYCVWILSCCDAVENDLPALVPSAEAAARLFVQEDYGIHTMGDQGMIGEAWGRAGGLMTMQRPAAKLIILMFPRENMLEKNIAQAMDMKKQGQFVVFFGRQAFIEAALTAGLKADAFINTHAAYHGGLVQAADGKWVLPTDSIAGMTTLWAWTGEFVAACTRLGKMPTMYQSIMVPGALERNAKIEKQKFHETVPQKIEALRLGKQYIAALRSGIQTLQTEQMAGIRKVADLAVKTLAAKHSCYSFVTGHAIRDHVEAPHSPGIFRKLSVGWGELNKNIKIAAGDLIFFIGYDSTFGPVEDLRKQGATLAWSLASYRNTAPIPKKDMEIAADEVFVDQCWDFGDAVVAIPGYDVNILPASGILAEAVLWLASAEALGLQRDAGRPMAALREKVIGRCLHRPDLYP